MKRFLLIAMMVSLQVSLQAMEPCIVGASACCIVTNLIMQRSLQDARERIEPKTQSERIQSRIICSPAYCANVTDKAMNCCCWMKHPFFGVLYATVNTTIEYNKYKKAFDRARDQRDTESLQH